ncbi:MAG TPA: hypothetical protein DFS52_28460 [Myxococcales bacterium]|nr:hypothetical protein [Myxococcales bacterium]
MSQAVLPAGESLRRAVLWISDRRRDSPQEKLAKVIDEACLRFDLSPLESDWLWRNLASLPDDRALTGQG